MSLYNPFEKFLFDTQTCFLTGAPLTSSEDRIHVIPGWLMDAYGLSERPIKMLDERIVTYGQLWVPCSSAAAGQIHQLEDRIQAAFRAGYHGVVKLEQVELFQWIGKLVYGMIFNEIQSGIRQQAMIGEPLNFSQVLVHKFRYLHTMLQSLVLPMQFDGTLPFSIHVFEVDNPDDFFSYRDEINTLVFSMRLEDFGIIACLQDNGTNGVYHEEYLKGVAGQMLHPIQFEEICGRFFYSAYLFNRLPEYAVMPTSDMVFVEPMSLLDGQTKPLFDAWQNKTFGQVLENFWKPWGFTLFEIVQNPEHPMTFLRNAEGHFIDRDEIDLPVGVVPDANN